MAINGYPISSGLGGVGSTISSPPNSLGWSPGWKRVWCILRLRNASSSSQFGIFVIFGALKMHCIPPLWQQELPVWRTSSEISVSTPCRTVLARIKLWISYTPWSIITPSCVSTLPGKTKATLTVHFEVSCYSISLLNRRMSLVCVR